MDVLFDPSLVLLAGIPGGQELPRGTPPQFGGFHVSPSHARPGHAGVPLSLAGVWCQWVPTSVSPPWLLWGLFWLPARRKEEGFPSFLPGQFSLLCCHKSSFPLHSLKVICVGAIGCWSLGARLGGFERAGQGPGRWAGGMGPWGREGSALISPAEAEVRVMETSGQLYLSPALVTIPARLPHCPEGNSSLSWWGWRGELGLAGTGQAGGWLCRGLEGGNCPPFPQTF